MRKTVLWLLLIVICVPSLAQQKPHYTQYILNQYILNPAITGIENYTDIRLSHRHQWTGFTDAPVTSYFTAHTSLGKKDDRLTATSFDTEGDNPRGRNYWTNYTVSGPHHGVGLQVINDQTGPISHLNAYATYAFHLGLSDRTSLAAGFGAGISRIGLDASKLQFYNFEVDPAVASSDVINRIRPDATVGLYLYSADYFVGVSAQQIIPQPIDYSNKMARTLEGRMVPHLFATAGYRFLIGDDLNFIPSALVKYVQPTPPQIDINGKLQYRDFAWVGASFRSEEGFAGMIGLNLSNRVNFSYSYDYTTSNLNNYSRGTHEFMLGFILSKGYKDACPRNVW